MYYLIGNEISKSCLHTWTSNSRSILDFKDTNFISPLGKNPMSYSFYSI